MTSHVLITKKCMLMKRFTQFFLQFSKYTFTLSFIILCFPNTIHRGQKCFTSGNTLSINMNKHPSSSVKKANNESVNRRTISCLYYGSLNALHLFEGQHQHLYGTGRIFIGPTESIVNIYFINITYLCNR